MSDGVSAMQVNLFDGGHSLADLDLHPPKAECAGCNCEISICAVWNFCPNCGKPLGLQAPLIRQFVGRDQRRIYFDGCRIEFIDQIKRLVSEELKRPSDGDDG